MKRIRALALLMLSLGLLVGCRRVAEPAVPLAAGDVHHAPHGGTLIEVGAHAYNLEFVTDPAAGTLTAFVLDAHAENFIRIAAPALELTAIVGAERRPLTLRAVANRATGETVGDTSQFDGAAAWLKDAPEFPATIARLDIRGVVFENVAVYVRKRP